MISLVHEHTSQILLRVPIVSLPLLLSAGRVDAVAIVGFQFGLYHVVAPLSFLRIISLASLFAKK